MFWLASKSSRVRVWGPVSELRALLVYTFMRFVRPEKIPLQAYAFHKLNNQPFLPTWQAHIIHTYVYSKIQVQIAMKTIFLDPTCSSARGWPLACEVDPSVAQTDKAQRCRKIIQIEFAS